MELRHLRYFTAVAGEGNFTRAAARLHVAQPAVSQQIRDLERELGATLIDRSQRPVRLTGAGQRLLADCRELFALLDRSRAAIERAAHGEVGRLRVGYPTGGVYLIVVELLTRFREEAPDAELELHPLPGPEQIRALHTRRVDIALVRLTEAVQDPGIVLTPVREEKLLVMVAASHPLATRTTVALQEVADRRFVMFPRHTEPLLAARYTAACVAAGYAPRLEIEVYDAQTQAMYVAADLGVALTGDGLSTRFPDVAYLPVEPPVILTRLATANRDEHPEPLLDLFLTLTTRLIH